MSHFAEVDSTNIVLRVLVAEQDFIDSGAVGDPKHWIQTSFNTRCGKHHYGGIPLRGNYASIGCTYSPELDAFLYPQPYPSWTLNTTTFDWDPPTERPTFGNDTVGMHPDYRYVWDEETLAWVTHFDILGNP